MLAYGLQYLKEENGDARGYHSMPLSIDGHQDDDMTKCTPYTDVMS